MHQKCSLALANTRLELCNFNFPSNNHFSNPWIDWLNGVLCRFQQYFCHITTQPTLFMSFLGYTSPRLGSEVSCPMTLHKKNPEDPVRLEPRTPGWRVKHFTTEPRGTLATLAKVSLESTVGKGENAGYQHFLLFLQCFPLFHGKILQSEPSLDCNLRTLLICYGLQFSCLVKS